MAIDKALEDQIKVPKTVYDEEVELEAGPPLGTDDIDYLLESWRKSFRSR